MADQSTIDQTVSIDVPEDTRSYKPRGNMRFRLSESKHPEPEVGELEALKEAAERLGYELMPKKVWPSLSHILQSALNAEPHRDLLRFLDLDGWTPRTVPNGAEDLAFYSDLSRRELREVFDLLPSFLRQLEEEEDLRVDFDMRFLAVNSDGESTYGIYFYWSEGKLYWSEGPTLLRPDQI